MTRNAPPTLDDVRATRAKFPTTLVRTTPLDMHDRLSAVHGTSVLLKGEDLQTVRSYKVRGAAAKLLSLSREELDRGIVCASAGNHAQGVSTCCNLLEHQGTIFMPRTTPLQKIEATQRRGNGHVQVRLEGDNFDETAHVAQQFSEESSGTFVHPFDDWNVIEGQATVALEIDEQLYALRQRLGAVVVPVGGGGLLAGTVLVMKELHPDATIYGVEPEGAACMDASVREGKPVKLHAVDSFVDGAAVAMPGERPFEVIRRAVQEGRVKLLTVSNNCLSATMADFAQIDGRIVEPAGALSSAALDQVVHDHPNGAVVGIVSGGNFDMRRMPTVLQNAELHRRTKVFLKVTLPDRPGALQEMISAIAPLLQHLNICYMQFDEDEENGSAPPLIVGFQSKEGNAQDIARLLETLREARFDVQELQRKPAH